MVSLNHAILLRDSALITETCNKEYGWGKYLTQAFLNNDKLVIDAISKNNGCNDYILFEYSMLAGAFDLAHEYFNTIISDDKVNSYNVSYYLTTDGNPIITLEETRHDKYYNLRRIEQKDIHCDIIALQTFINKIMGK
jgi:hypothetical protein